LVIYLKNLEREREVRFAVNNQSIYTKQAAMTTNAILKTVTLSASTVGVNAARDRRNTDQAASARATIFVSKKVGRRGEPRPTPGLE
jgi:hypothetical protein